MNFKQFVLVFFFEFVTSDKEADLSKQTPPGLKCYVCNSARDPRCGDPFNPDTIELVDCNQYMPERNATLCRKNIQTVSLGSREDTRIVRTCGWEPEYSKLQQKEDSGEEDKTRPTSDRCYKRTGTFEVTVTYCSCKGFSCNGGSVLTNTVVSVATIAMAVGLV